MSGWIVPVKDDSTKYPLNSNTFYITTESVTGGSDEVYFSLWTDSGGHITNIIWRFSDWGYVIIYCTPNGNFIKFPVTPPTGVNKTWEITFTTVDVKIKCNSLQVLHYDLYLANDNECIDLVADKIATRIEFNTGDTATKMFSADQVGK